MSQLTITAVVTDPVTGEAGTGSVTVEVVLSPAMHAEAARLAAMSPLGQAEELDRILADARPRIARPVLPDHAERARQMWSQVR